MRKRSGQSDAALVAYRGSMELSSLANRPKAADQWNRCYLADGILRNETPISLHCFRNKTASALRTKPAVRPSALKTLRRQERALSLLSVIPFCVCVCSIRELEGALGRALTRDTIAPHSECGGGSDDEVISPSSSRRAPNPFRTNLRNRPPLRSASTLPPVSPWPRSIAVPVLPTPRRNYFRLTRSRHLRVCTAPDAAAAAVEEAVAADGCSLPVARVRPEEVKKFANLRPPRKVPKVSENACQRFARSVEEFLARMGSTTRASVINDDWWTSRGGNVPALRPSSFTAEYERALPEAHRKRSRLFDGFTSKWGASSSEAHESRAR
ncbi:hypothetical protein HPB51_025126 [Rhipicephalus microplus]|uniref:Uncharacterized protein n=1 Tax=Rhipicephalus microplus TaxID=6941 RepID=A0A9J6DQX3_RHIMP|nr:hypothetical protein HPB51_025126 [Rhipicephalus microplus]